MSVNLSSSTSVSPDERTQIQEWWDKFWAHYPRRVEKKKAPTQTSIIKRINGRMILNREMPAAFIARSSSRSPKLPNVINEARRIDRGKAIGVKDKAA